MAKNANQRLDQVEEVVGSVQQELRRFEGSVREELQSVGKRLELLEDLPSRLEHLIKLQEESARGGSSATEKMKGPTIYNPSPLGDSPGYGGNSSGSGHGTRQDFRMRRLEMPTFDGSNPDGWILKAERYFTLNHFSNDEKLEAAVIAFEGDALLWYQWECKKLTMVLWEEMKLRLLRQFRSTHTGSLHEQWIALKQEGSVRDYR